VVAVLVAFPVLGALLIFQSAVISQIRLLQGTADVLLVVVIAWALQKRVKTGWHWGIIGGLLVSFVSGLPYGASLAGYLLAVGLALLLRQRVWQVPILAMLIATFFGTLLAHLAALIALQVAGTTMPFWESLSLVTLPSVFLNMMISIPVYAIVADLAKWVYPERLEM
jgi:rod shape-determining protein MreD